jgi:hypothetical protein
VEEQRTNGAQLVLLASILGILSVIAALYLMLPQPTAAKEPRYGRTEEALRDEYTKLLRKADLSTEYVRCRYHPKSLALGCEVPPLKESNLLVAANELGWKAGDKDKNQSAVLVKVGYVLAMACPSNKAEKSCEVTLHARNDTGA